MPPRRCYHTKIQYCQDTIILYYFFDYVNGFQHNYCIIANKCAIISVTVVTILLVQLQHQSKRDDKRNIRIQE